MKVERQDLVLFGIQDGVLVSDDADIPRLALARMLGAPEQHTDVKCEPRPTYQGIRDIIPDQDVIGGRSPSASHRRRWSVHNTTDDLLHLITKAVGDILKCSAAQG
jgi:hypothetical protein